MAKSTKIKVPPSRKKYEQSHPVLSFRVPKEMYDELQRIRKAGGRSLTDILKLGMGKAQRDNKKTERMKQQAQEEGYKKGYSEAENLYKVMSRCCVCGEMIPVTDIKAKQVAGEYLTTRGWKHIYCD